MKRLLKSLLVLCLPAALFAQENKSEDKGTLTGSLILSHQMYDRDDAIGANTLVYKTTKSSTDAWLYLDYKIKGYRFAMRYDVFNNTPLLNPQDAYTANGIGYWQAAKQIDKLDITVGYFYDQFGSGIIYRSYEVRPLGLDFATQGLRLEYKFNENTKLKGFTGMPKGDIGNRFGVNPQVLKGINLEHRQSAGKFGEFDLGASFLNRTLDRATMGALVEEINSYDTSQRFFPKYNVYAWNAYAAWNWRNFRLGAEYNRKSAEAYRNLRGTLDSANGQVLLCNLEYSAAGFGKNAGGSLGLNLQYRHIDKYSLRYSPFQNVQQPLYGFITYLPSLTRQNAYRLLARYQAPAQDLGENGIQGELVFTPKFGTTFNVNVSNVRSLASNGDSGRVIRLYEEFYLDWQQTWGKKKKIQTKLGIQTVYYNQARYEQEPEYEPVQTLTPFGEITVKLKKKRSVRFEWQYLYTDKDQGSFLNTMLEFNVSPYWNISVGDMVNTQPHRYANMIIENRVIHYPTVFTSYTVKNSVFTFAYLKQQAGVNCAGGICRVEPAFSGFRFTASTNF
jgi:hypothetical protein